MDPHQERSRRTFEHIVSAILDEFEEFGYAGATYRGIASRAGVSTSLVSYHFPTKAGMAETVFARAFPGGIFMSDPAHPDNPLDGLIRSTETIARALLNDQVARVAVRLQAERVLIDAELPPPYLGWIRRTRESLQEAVARGELPADTDVHTESVLLVASFVGLGIMARWLDDPAQVVKLAVKGGVDRLTALGAVGLSLPAGLE